MTDLAPTPDHVAPDRVFDFDIFSDARIDEDVQGSYARALKTAPDIFWTPRNGGHWMVRRSELIAEIATDFEHFSSSDTQIPKAPTRTVLIPLNLDPPENMPFRKVLMQRFSGKAIKEMEPRLRAMATALVDQVADAGKCDFADDVAAIYPVSVFMLMMGLPHERLREFRELADAYFSAQSMEDLAGSDQRLTELLTQVIEKRKVEPGDDLVSHILASEIDGRPLSFDQILSMCVLLFLGGMDTVTNLTGFAFQALAKDVALQDRLARHPDLVPQFVEEALRLFAVVSAPRLIAKDVERFGVTFRQGEMISCLLMMAGRDETVNPNPDVLDIDRVRKSHLTFSTGPHLCIGHILARAELRILTEAWLDRIPRFRAVPGAPHGFRMGNINAMTSLPLEWDLAR